MIIFRDIITTLPISAQCGGSEHGDNHYDIYFCYRWYNLPLYLQVAGQQEVGSNFDHNEKRSVAALLFLLHGSLRYFAYTYYMQIQ